MMHEDNKDFKGIALGHSFSAQLATLNARLKCWHFHEQLRRFEIFLRFAESRRISSYTCWHVLGCFWGPFWAKLDHRALVFYGSHPPCQRPHATPSFEDIMLVFVDGGSVACMFVFLCCILPRVSDLLSLLMFRLLGFVSLIRCCLACPDPPLDILPFEDVIERCQQYVSPLSPFIFPLSAYSRVV